MSSCILHAYWRPLGCKLWCGPRTMVFGIRHLARCFLSFPPTLLLILSSPVNQQHGCCRGKWWMFWKAGAQTQKVGSSRTIALTWRRKRTFTKLECLLAQSQISAIPLPLGLSLKGTICLKSFLLQGTPKGSEWICVCAAIQLRVHHSLWHEQQVKLCKEEKLQRSPGKKRIGIPN